MPWNLASKTITRVWQFIDQFTAAETIDRTDLDVAFGDVTGSVNDAIAYLLTEIEGAASSELYLGVAPSPPTNNAGGGPLIQGNLYIKSPEYEAFVWTGSEWTLAEQFAAASSYFKGLVTAADAGALRSLLGLGSAATFASTSFASASEIAAAAERLTNALQPVQTGGTGSAFTITSPDPVTSLVQGQGWLLRANRAPTGAATLNVDGLGPRDIRKIDATNSLADIASGDWAVGDLVPVFYDGVRFIVPRYGLLKAGAQAAKATQAIGAAGVNDADFMTALTTKAAIDAMNPIKAWVNFNGVGTVAIRASFNVSSVTDLGVGHYRINFLQALSDSNYAVAGQASNSRNLYGGGPQFTTTLGIVGAPATTFVEIATLYTFDPSVRDVQDVHAIIVR